MLKKSNTNSTTNEQATNHSNPNEKTTHNHESKKHEDNMFDNIEKTVEHKISKFEEQINKYSKKWILEKVLKMKQVEKILNSKIVSDFNKKIEKDLETIFKVLWWLALIGWVLSLLMFLWLLFGKVWSGVVWWPLRALLYMATLLATSTIWTIEWFWMIKKKQWLPFVAIVNFWVNVLAIIISLIPITYVYWQAIRAWIWNSILNFAIMTIVLILILKNQKLFNNK